MALENELPLLSTIATSLSAAFVLGLIAAKLRISPIVGYLLAGVLIGPYTPGLIANTEIAEELAEIGIVLLMFGVGLHFSIKDLMDVKKIALPGAIVQMTAATMMGALLAQYAWGWRVESSLMFGLSLSVASTVVLLRALEQHNLLQTNNGRIAIGWLIVEDLAMVVALVLVPALALSNPMPEMPMEPAIAAAALQAKSPLVELFIAIGKVGAFIIVMMLVGKRILPWLLSVVAKTGSRELFTLAVFATALGIAFGSAKLFDISFALGAFFAGMMIRESDLTHEVADRSLPFQDAFAVLFFVAVGMLFDPAIIIDEPEKVTLTVAIIVIGKSLAAFLLVILLRYPLKTGFLVSASLAQIGEFSFILVALGTSYGLLPPEGRDLVLAGAIISIALNPLIFRLSHWAYACAGRSQRMASLFNVEENDLSHLRKGEEKDLKDLVILVGHGRVGRYISRYIQESHIDLVIIDSNRERVDTLRENGYHAIAGDASYPGTLHEAVISKAVAIAIAIPDPFAARRVVDNAREINPKIKILVRAHNDEELNYFIRKNADLAITGPSEIGRRMAEFLNEMRRKRNGG